MDSTKLPFGKSVGPVESYCDPVEIAAFALAINDDNPRYQDGRAVPPTYAVVAGLPPYQAISMALPDDAMEGGRGAGHGEHDLYIHRLPQPGTALYTTAEVSAAVVSKAGMNVFMRVASVDEQGELVFEQFWSAISLGPVTGGNQGRELADHTFPEDARARPVGTLTLATTRDQTFRYAGASGDRSIIHVNDKVATLSTGNDRGKFMQGAGTLGVASRALVNLAAGGDANRIRRVAVRFARYAYPGDEIAVSVYDIGPLADGGHAYAFEAESGGQTVLRHGLVEVNPL